MTSKTLAVLLVVVLVVAACGGPQAVLPPSPTPTNTAIVPTDIPTPAAPTVLPTALPTEAPTPTSTPIPPTPTPVIPQAQFSLDISEGSAPLVVSFTNLSQNASEFLWDFGDGATSTEENPSHTYTRVGVYTVNLQVSLVTSAGILSDRQSKSDLITVRPGPLAEVMLSPSTVTLRPEDTQDFLVEGFDQFGNLIALLNLSWTADPEAGTITPRGVFQGGTRAGQYPASIRVVASAEGVSKQAIASVTIRPGPVDQALVTGSESSIYTGDTAEFSVQAKDRYGNSIPNVDVVWDAEGGQIAKTGRYQASRQPGEFTVTAIVSDGEAEAQGVGTISVEQGYCTTEEMETVWDAQWYALNNDRTFGSFLGGTTYVGNFSVAGKLQYGGFLGLDQGYYGALFAEQGDMLGLRATTTIVVQRQGPVKFAVGGDDGYRLFLNGNKILYDWTDHPYLEKAAFINLDPGMYELELQYYEYTGEAFLKFETDADVLVWSETVQCFGGYSQPPVVRFFTHSPQGQTLSQLADRFDISVQELSRIKPSSGLQVLLPGARDVHKKVIYLQGLSSSGSCEDDQRDTLVLTTRAIQTMAPSLPSDVDADDVIGFSYSGNYVDCDTGIIYDSSSYPLTTSVAPMYEPSDTCLGVENAANELATLMNRIIDEDPEVSFDLVGHSMGGMVAAHLVSQTDKDVVLEHINSVVTLDSPLGSFNPYGYQYLHGTCKVSDPAWQDILGTSSVVREINSVRDAQILSRFLSVEATEIGSHIRGTNAITVAATCATGSTLLGATTGATIGSIIPGVGTVIGAIIGAIIGATTGGHACVVVDDEALRAIANAVNSDS